MPSRRDTAPATIVDDDDPPVLLQSSFLHDPTSEDIGASWVRFSLTGASEKPISFDYATAPVTALAPSDYATASGTVNFAGAEGEGGDVQDFLPCSPHHDHRLFSRDRP